MNRIIPVITLNKVEERTKILEALRHKGIMCGEICFRTDCAEEAIRLAVREFPDMEIGAGTVINRKQCEAAISAGAKFIVSPGLSEDVAALCKSKSIPYYPGCVTPTEIMKALELGINVVKFFPADIYGGLAAIKALGAPFPGVRFIPTGGVNSKNMDEFLKCDKVFAVGGSSFVKEALSEWKE